MPRKPNPERTAWQAAARERLRQVVDKKFEGNQSELAAALGVTRALVSIVLRSAQPPTKNLMARLGTIPGINPRWADSGEGDAFGPDTHGTLPVACGILPGWPERYPALLSGERFPAAEAFSQQSRYWLKVDATCPALRAAELALLAGDMLLLDANAALWVDRLSECVGKMFGLCVRRGEQVSYTLALLRSETVGLVFDGFTDNYKFAAPSPCPASPAPAKAKGGVRYQRMPRVVRPLKPVDEETTEADISETKTPASARVTPPSVPFVGAANIAQPSVITPEDLIAIRVGMYRQ